MYFNEKLQLLRKDNNMTQEELAEKLYVSRTAVSKWESGKGYPNIDSLKGISKLFSVSIDELLLGEKIIEYEEKNKKPETNKKYNFIYGIIDFLMPIFIFIPTFGKNDNGYIKSVNLFGEPDISSEIMALYYVSFFVLMLFGIAEMALQKKRKQTINVLNCASIVMSMVAMLIFVNSRQPYMSTYLFVILILKIMLLNKLDARFFMTRKVS